MEDDGLVDVCWCYIKEKVLNLGLIVAIIMLFFWVLLWATPLARGGEHGEAGSTNVCPIVTSVEDTNETANIERWWISTAEMPTATFEWVADTFHISIGHLNNLPNKTFNVIVTHHRLEEPLSIDCIYETTRTVITVRGR